MNEEVKVQKAESSSDENIPKEAAGNEQKIISGCAFAGAAIFFIINKTHGVLPGGFAGGVIGGGIGAVVGMIINFLKKNMERD